MEPGQERRQGSIYTITGVRCLRLRPLDPKNLHKFPRNDQALYPALFVGVVLKSLPRPMQIQERYRQQKGSSSASQPQTNPLAIHAIRLSDRKSTRLNSS